MFQSNDFNFIKWCNPLAAKSFLLMDFSVIDWKDLLLLDIPEMEASQMSEASGFTRMVQDLRASFQRSAGTAPKSKNHPEFGEIVKN